MHITDKELEKLQQLALIKLDDDQKEQFHTKLDDIVSMLEALQQIDIDENIDISSGKILQPQVGQQDFPDSKKLLQNVKHDVMNNSVVIKSVLE